MTSLSDRLEELADSLGSRDTDLMEVQTQLREAAQSARIPEDMVLRENHVELNMSNYDIDAVAALNNQHIEYLDTIEAQASEIARLKSNYETAQANWDLTLDRAEAAEARCVELTKEQDEYKDARDCYLELKQRYPDGIQHWIEAIEAQADEARAQVTALTAANAVLREAMEEVLRISYRDHVAWHKAQAALSTPNDKAMRMVEVVQAAEDWQQAEYNFEAAISCDETSQLRMLSDRAKTALDHLRNALTDGERG